MFNCLWFKILGVEEWPIDCKGAGSPLPSKWGPQVGQAQYVQGISLEEDGHPQFITNRQAEGALW